MRIFLMTAGILTAGVVLMTAVPVPALAVANPIVANIRPIIPNGPRGRVSFFQLGGDVVVNVTLDHERAGTRAAEIRRGSCASLAPQAQWNVVDVSGTQQTTRLPKVELNQLLGHAFVVNATQDHSSPVIGCADIRDAD
jgi:hypothetical protein